MTTLPNHPPIGLVAIRPEAAPLLACMEDRRSERLGEAMLHTGQIGARRVALAAVLIGPVHAAMGAQALVLRCGVERLISFGSAGALDPALAVGDVVIGRRAVPHDAGALLPSGLIPVGVNGLDLRGRAGNRRAFVADPGLVALALAAGRSAGARAYAGTIVTGSQTVLSTGRARWLRRTFDALAVDMETAAVAQVAAAYRLPWVAVRAISDQAGDLDVDFGRLFIFIDGGGPRWLQSARRLLYVAAHPAIRRQLLSLQRGLKLAAVRAAHVVEAMFDD